MNSSSRVDILPSPTANNAQSKTKSSYSSATSTEFQAEFKNQLKTAANQVESLVKQLHLKLADNKLGASGGSLPMNDSARKFIAALPAADQQQVVEGVSRWLADMSPEEVKKLQQDLKDDPEGVMEKLPKELRDLLASLEDTEGFPEFLAGLLGADIDFQRLAVIARGDYLSLVAKDSAMKADDSTAAFNNKLDVKQQLADLNLLGKDKVGELVSSLSSAGALGAVRAGGETLNQLLQSAGMGLTGVQAAGATAQTATRTVANLASIPFMQQAAAESNAQSLANRINLMNAKNMQVAEMRLDPPSLGSVRVQIRMDGDQATVVFQAANAHARELLEQSLPKLREMMEAQGLMLADAQVSDESFAGQNQGKEQAAADQSGQQAGSGLTGDEEGSDGMEIPLLTQPLGLIDYYA
ncbi:MAG: flagellar hook-length control protein FliK [Pseudomonadaceae bacterium]|nr:flagellar hook-length control protein FliK [Pseudomonadaceae bacterium]